MSRIHQSRSLSRIVVSITTLMALSGAGPVGADAVTDWHATAINAIYTAVPPRPGPVGFLDLAIVQAAVHDAVQAIEKRFEPYHVVIPDASGSPIAATASAAHDVLVAIVPGQQASLDAAYHTYLSTYGLAEDDPGVAVGQAAAAGMLALRGHDGRVPDPLPPNFIGGTDPGVWRPTVSYQPGPPPSLAPMATPWLGSVPPFTLKSGDQYRASPPYPLDSKRYAVDYNEVKALGGRFNSDRSAEQTELAYFYATNLPPLFQRTLNGVAATYVGDIADSARLIALATLAIADAIITAWDNKITYVYWRPVTAIQLGDADGNPDTVPDAGWQPFINTPNYPEYTSGANNVTGALTRTLELFFETDAMSFSVTTDQPLASPKTRTYARFSDLAQDMVDVRIYHGVHFRNADEQARKQGRLVAQWVFGHFLRPLGEDFGN